VTRFFVFIFLILSNLVYGQNTTDYAVYQKQHQTIGCQVIDSVIFAQVLTELLALDTTQFTSNLDLYHRDLSQAYGCKWLFSKDSSDYRNAVKQLDQIKQPSNADHYNMAFYLAELNEYEQALVHLNRHIAMTPPDQLLTNEIRLIKNKCMYRHITDYKEYRNTQNKVTCTVQDSATIVTILYDLLLLDTNRFTTNLDYYYQDLGMAYYKSYGFFDKDPLIYQRAIAAYLKQKVLSSDDYWNIMHLYFLLHDCVGGEIYLELFKRHTSKAIYKERKEEISRMREGCSGK
jgi:tetratricopeptide (TPR) repeat protein